MANIIVIDDDKTLRKNLAFYLRSQGYDVDIAESGEEGVERIKEKFYDIVITDCRMGQMSGLELLKIARRIRPASDVIIITGYGDIPMAVEAIQNGARDFLSKPFEYSRLLDIIERALSNRETKVTDKDNKYERIITKSQKMTDILDLIAKAADTAVAVLIEGEPGTGKELVARSIHARSCRRDKAFITIESGTLNEQELRQELFGNWDEKENPDPGGLVEADGGTLFIRDIEKLSPNLQARLLHFMQDGFFTTPEKFQKIKSDARIICSSTKSLKKLVTSNGFREDLFYAINIMPIYIPPLRNRVADIFPLVSYFLEKYSAKFKKDIKALSPDVLAWMQTYQWPGNVAELENVIARATALATTEYIDESLIFTLPKDTPASEEGPGFLNLTLRDNQKTLILKALRQNSGNFSRTAQQLGISRTTLWRRMKKFQIDKPVDEGMTTES
ncbi:MAG: sigma-54-dependent Fis family transcriptional regulator [candidate division Zixibacteria bacterium]|nr:sigma-54-dependent Fis family transcriptional regulator [candidate division Zixibacteria bacterium]